MIVEGKTGFTYPVGSVDKLANCMKKLIDDRVARREMGRDAASFVKKFSVETTVAVIKEGEEGA